MSGDIVSFLHLDKDLNSNTAITVVKDMKGCDNSFITSCVLGHSIKNKIPTLVILLHHSLSHYQNVGLKMFHNVNKAISSGFIQTLDLGEYCIGKVINGNSVNIKELIMAVTEKLEVMQSNYGSANVIVDGLSHMFDLGYSLKDVNKMCREIVKITRKCEKSFVIFNCHVSNEEDVTSTMASLLSHMAYTVLELRSLASGWSADVSGHLSLTYPGKKFESEHQNILDTKSVQYHYKLFEKGVKLFAPGTV